MISSEVKLNFRGGGSFVSLKPLFSYDAQTVYLAWKNVVYGYSTKTSKRILEFKGLSTSVAGFGCHFLSGYECITALSLYGDVITWKADTAFRMTKKTFPINGTIHSLNIIPSNGENDAEALVLYTSEDQYACSASLFDLTSCKLKPIKNMVLKSSPYSADVNKHFFAIVQGNKLYYAYLSDCGSGNISRRHIGSSRFFTCVVCHPSEEYVLTGDTTGRVVLWYNLGSSSPSQAVYHWHTLPVNSICFSSSGSYFYSGAGECVLVKWQIDNVNERKYLPRLAAGIRHVSVSGDNLFVAVATEDNGVRIFDPHFELISVVQHLVLGVNFRSGIHVDFRTKSLIMNGITGHVQFYCPSNMNLLYNLDVVGQNRLARERKCNIKSTQVTRIALSENGFWLSVCQEREDKKYSSEVSLKFFRFEETKQNFELNTFVQYPHEGGVTGMLFQPVKIEREMKCVTIGKDKKFKIWRMDEEATCDVKFAKKIVWVCQSVGFFRDLPSKSLAFSFDGSLFAVGFDNVLTTWLPDSCELKCSLFHSNVRSPIKYIEFGHSNQCHLLVAGHKEQLCVWNLLTLSMIWTVSIRVNILVADSLTNHMAVFSGDNKLFIFSPISSQPIFSTAEFMPKNVTVKAATFVPSAYSGETDTIMGNKWYHQSHLYFIDSNEELYYFGANADLSESYSVQSNDDNTLYKQAMPQLKSGSLQTPNFTRHRYVKDPSYKNLEKFLEAPVHTMIPMRLMCESLLRSFVIQSK